MAVSCVSKGLTKSYSAAEVTPHRDSARRTVPQNESDPVDVSERIARDRQEVDASDRHAPDDLFPLGVFQPARFAFD